MEHHFNTDIAKDYGIEEAIMLHNLFFWICKNAANGKNFYDGSYWTYNSVAGYTRLFPYLNIDKVKRVLSLLLEKGLIKKGNYNENRMNHTNWYAFTEKGLEYMSSHDYNLPNTNSAKPAIRLVQNAPIDKGENDQSNKDNKHKDNKLIKPTNVGMSLSNDPARIDFDKLINCFNEELAKHGAVIPKIASMTERRRQAIRARIKEHGKQALLSVIKKTAASSFLNGRNNRSFVGSFDWIMKPNNFVKVLEGNYDDNINSLYDGNNRTDFEKEQRAREVAEAISRRFAEDDAAEQAGVIGEIQSR